MKKLYVVYGQTHEYGFGLADEHDIIAICRDLNKAIDIAIKEATEAFDYYKIPDSTQLDLSNDRYRDGYFRRCDYLNRPFNSTARANGFRFTIDDNYAEKVWITVREMEIQNDSSLSIEELPLATIVFGKDTEEYSYDPIKIFSSRNEACAYALEYGTSLMNDLGVEPKDRFVEFGEDGYLGCIGDGEDYSVILRTKTLEIQ